MENHREKFKREFIGRLVRFSISVMRLTDSLSDVRTLRSSLDQLIRSASSIGANVTEAQAGSSKKDFSNYMSIALKSANETQYWLLLIKTYHNTSQSLVDPILDECKQIARMLSSIRIKLKEGKS